MSTADAAVYVLDSFAILAYAEEEPPAERIEYILRQCQAGHRSAVLSVINLGEVLYITERERGLFRARAVLAAIEQLPLEVLPASKGAVLAAAHIKARYAISYADAFAVAAAHELHGIIVTGDPEFRRVRDLVSIEWLPGTRSN
jgi:predicted nucleic acid-binding protein